MVGPTGDDPITLLGCYSFPAHIGVHHPELPLGVAIPTVLEAVRSEFPDCAVTYAPGCHVSEPGTDGFAAALAAAAGADLVIAALGDRSGLFGRGTSGEGCDAPSLRLPGVQAELLEALLDGPAPVLLVVDSGRPYALGTAPERAAGIVQMFFPGEEGGPALAGVLSGRVNPSGRLPVSIPTSPYGQPWTYLSQKLALASGGVEPGPDPGLPVRRGPLVQQVLLVRPVGAERATGYRRHRRGGADRGQHRHPGRRRGGPAVPARPGRVGDPARWSG